MSLWTPSGDYGPKWGDTKVSDLTVDQLKHEIQHAVRTANTQCNRHPGHYLDGCPLCAMEGQLQHPPRRQG